MDTHATIGIVHGWYKSMKLQYLVYRYNPSIRYPERYSLWFVVDTREAIELELSKKRVSTFDIAWER